MRYSITRVTPEPSFRELDAYDFEQKARALIAAPSCSLLLLALVLDLPPPFAVDMLKPVKC